MREKPLMQKYKQMNERSCKKQEYMTEA